MDSSNNMNHELLSILWKSSRHGDVKHILKKIPKTNLLHYLNYPDEKNSGRTSLHMAVVSHSISNVFALLSAGMHIFYL